MRELREETGYCLSAAPEPVGTGSEPYPDVGIELRHTFYLIHAERFDPRPVALEARESEWFVRLKWWPLRALPVNKLPQNLAESVRALLSDQSGPIEFV